MGAAEMVSIVGPKAVNQAGWQASAIDRQALSLDFSYLGEWGKCLQEHVKLPKSLPVTNYQRKDNRVYFRKIDATTHISIQPVFPNFRKQNELFREYMMGFSWNTKHFTVPAGCRDSSFSSLYFVLGPEVKQQILPFVFS